MRTDIDIPFHVGRYLISPITRPLDDGRFHASVSVRSGRGSMTHDRVLRLATRFQTRADAVRGATAEGLAWVRQHGAPGRRIPHPTQEPTAWPRKI